MIRTFPRRALQRVRHPQTTVRWRLTLLYGGLFLVCGAALLAVTYGLVQHATTTVSPRRIEEPYRKGVKLSRPPVVSHRHVAAHPSNGLPPTIQRTVRSSAGKEVIKLAGSQQRLADLRQLEIESLIALGVMALLAALLGWIVAGRVLAPLRAMTSRTREISEDNLHERLALDGPPDELHELADTIDALLARMQSAFDAQRRFATNASHELRTPLTAVRALLEMVLSDPHADVESFRTVCRHALDETAMQEHLIDALLALARGQRGLDRQEPLDLAEITAQVLAPRGLKPSANGLRMESSLAPAPLSGDRWLVRRLVANLVDNAIRHNIADGHVEVNVASIESRATLTVRNTGPQIPASEVRRLLAPFQRLGAERVNDGAIGLGLGLSIVEAIAHAHAAELDLCPPAGGGLVVLVRFPAVPAEVRSPPPPGADRHSTEELTEFRMAGQAPDSSSNPRSQPMP